MAAEDYPISFEYDSDIFKLEVSVRFCNDVDFICEVKNFDIDGVELHRRMKKHLIENHLLKEDLQ